MTMVSTGEISIGGSATSGGLNRSINIELGRSATATSSLNESALRTLAGVPSGAISLSNFYGKANQFAFTISSNQTNANLRTLAVNAGWNQSSKVVATIGSGVYISSNSTGTPGLTVDGSFPGGVDLINNGFIIGMGGAGGAGSNAGGNGVAGAGGGLALSVSVAVTVTNNGTIGGGGGGGGGGQSVVYVNSMLFIFDFYGGGGGGGGRTGATNSSGGAGGVPTGSGPGRINGSAGGAGTSGGGGAGGAGGSGPSGTAGTGGAGATWGSAGATGGSATGFAAFSPGAGGAAGAAITGNSNITYIATGTRLGAIT
jgi:hypothetical protein